MTEVHLPFQANGALIILNGRRICLDLPYLPPWQDYSNIVVTDGAWNDFQNTQLASAKNIICIGDGDSIHQPPEHFIHMECQQTTDAEKAIMWLLKKGIRQADIMWGNDGEMDHFLGNMSLMAKYAEHIQLRFFDEKHCIFFVSEHIDKQQTITHARHHQMSLYPFPKATVSADGLEYPVTQLVLTQHHQQSLRNVITKDNITISLCGSLLVFLSLQPKLSSAEVNA